MKNAAAEEELDETIYGWNSKFHKSITLEAMSILWSGKRYSVRAGEIYMHAKFQNYEPNTKLVNDGKNWDFDIFRPRGRTIIFKVYFTRWKSKLKFI